MLVPEIPPPFQPGEPLSAGKFNRALNPLQQLANLHVYPPLVLEQDPTGYHIRLQQDLLTYIGGDITNPIAFYNSAFFLSLVDLSQATLIFPSAQPVNLYQGLIWIIPGSCSMYYYCDGKIKKVTATESGGGGGGGGNAEIYTGSPILATTTASWVTIAEWDAGTPKPLFGGWAVRNNGASNTARIRWSAIDVFGNAAAPDTTPYTGQFFFTPGQESGFGSFTYSGLIPFSYFKIEIIDDSAGSHADVRVDFFVAKGL